MKIYEITVKPISGFGTPLKGDTIFGHFCWQIFYDDTLIGKSLEDLLFSYSNSPFIIFSSMFPKFSLDNGGKYTYALKTPNLPVDKLFNIEGDKKEKISKRKEYKNKKWMLLKEGKKFKFFKDLELINDKELYEKAQKELTEEYKMTMHKTVESGFISSINQYHNKIDRNTGTTGGEGFAPYAVEQEFFYPEVELALFIGIDETVVKIDQVKEGLERIGSLGFGKDASTGLGRFALAKEGETNLADMGSDKPNACYTLSPCVPQKNIFSEMYFTPFTRFGKHGDVLAKSSNPFKNPVIMADEGGIFKPETENGNDKKIFNKPYIGTSVTSISKVEPKTISQGYSLYIPVEV